jgi:hypothetical protein
VTDVQELAGMLATSAWAGRRLTFDEVIAAGRPAVYRKFGDHLLYVQGRLFDVSEPAAPVEVGLAPPSSTHRRPPTGREVSVGIEYGWRHSAECGCDYCSDAA